MLGRRGGPIRADRGGGAIILLDTRGRDALAVDSLMALADQALGQRATLPPPIETASLACAEGNQRTKVAVEE
jgi:hypothetical protein